MIPGRCVGLSWISLEEGVAILQQSMAVGDGWWMDGGWMDGSMVNEEDGLNEWTRLFLRVLT